jgi:HSP20 family protein
MSISRWDPWNDMMNLRDAMDQVVREGFTRPRSGSELGITLDVMEQDDSFMVDAVLPGVKPDEVNLQIKDDVLMISGDIKDQHEQKQGNWLRRERRFGHYQRTITLPSSIDADQVSATFQDGVLHITLPKSRESRARAIPINTGR